MLILEPQDWKSYRKKARLTPQHKAMYKAVKLRPEQFHSCLMNEIGFKYFEVVKRGTKKSNKTTPKAPVSEVQFLCGEEKKEEKESKEKNDATASGFDRGIFLYRK